MEMMFLGFDFRLATKSNLINSNQTCKFANVAAISHFISFHYPQVSPGDVMKSKVNLTGNQHKDGYLFFFNPLHFTTLSQNINTTDSEKIRQEELKSDYVI